MEFDKPSRDELLDAYDVIIRESPQSLRAKLDCVYESGFAEGVAMMRKQIEEEQKL